MADKIDISGVTVLGTIATTVVYMLSLTVAFADRADPQTGRSTGPPRAQGRTQGART